jgi:hypothetical protein
MNAAPPAGPHNYDVYFVTPDTPRFYFSNPNRGIAVSERGLSWTADGHADEAAFADIAAIHLQTAALGNAERVIDQCRIEFVNGTRLVVSNASSNGLPDPAQTPLYRAFVRDLHGRPALRKSGTIRFTAGMAPWRYKMLFVTMIVAGLFFIATPAILAAVTGDWHALIVGGAGVIFCWPFTKMLMNNGPRDYTPDNLPDELLS